THGLFHKHDMRFSEGTSATARSELKQGRGGRGVADRIQLPISWFGLPARPDFGLELNLALGQTCQTNLELEGLSDLKRQRSADPSIGFAAFQPRGALKDKGIQLSHPFSGWVSLAHEVEMLAIQNQSQTKMGVSERSRVLDHCVQTGLQGNLDTAGDWNLAAEPGKGILVRR